jgi:2-polyprenyl-3-methyl-5-hydroxy-6-metoxy-1,4-benzoquinol methylase
VNTSQNDNKDARFIPSISEQKKYWDVRWIENSIPNDWQLRRGETIIEMLKTISIDQPKMLDLGCATGWFTERLSQIGEVQGIDLSDEAISIAKIQYPQLEFISGNMFAMSLKKEAYDIVVAQEIFAHVENQIGFIERISSILKPGGFLVISSANKIVMKRVDFGPDPREHIKQWMNMKDMKRLLRPHFHVLRARTIIPMGDQGFLRVVNSHKLNTALGWLIPRKYLEFIKERVGLGYSIVILAKKREK